MDCKSTEKNLIFYIENSLPPGEIAVIEAHVNKCSACQEKMKYLQETLSLIETTKNLSPEPFLFTRIMGRMQQSAVNRSGVWKPIAVTGALLIGLFLGFWLGQAAVYVPAKEEATVYEVAYLFHDNQIEHMETLLLDETFYNE